MRVAHLHMINGTKRIQTDLQISAARLSGAPIDVRIDEKMIYSLRICVTDMEYR